tara:strand:- start:77 stop:430 length:354 start_codon:yes stop_codon:yes gene_type:complete
MKKIEKSVRLMDTQTRMNCPTSRFLKKEEIKDKTSETHPGRINFIFRFNMPLEVKSSYAKILMAKYPSVVKYGEDKKVDKYGTMSYKELKEEAKKKGIPLKETMVKRDVLEKIVREK